MKRRFSCFLAFVLLAALTLQACSFQQNQPYLKKDASEAAPLKAVRYESPSMLAYSEPVSFMVGFLGGFLGGIIGAIPVIIIYYQSCKLPDDPNMPDFGKLVIDKFAERAKEEIPNWPVMVVEGNPVEEVLEDKTSYLLVFNVHMTEIEKSTGLHFNTSVSMKDREGKIIWHKNYLYESQNFNRETDYDILEKDDKKILKEEIAFAAEQTASDFINYFKNPEPEKQLQAKYE